MKKNCFGCNRSFPVQELTFQFADQFGEMNLCSKCIYKAEEGDTE